jgi:ABC-type uncharacterized transport system permease subunit
MSPTVLAIVAIATYAVATVCAAFARTGRPGPWHGLALAAGALALALHAGFHVAGTRELGGLDLHFYSALSLVGAGMSAVTLAIALLRPAANVGLIVFPIALLTLALDAGLARPVLSAAAQDWRITLHALLALLGFATFGIAAVVAIVLAIQERALRAHRVAIALRAFPPLTLVEALLFQLIGTGFGLLSVTLLTGALFVEDLFAQHLVHKTVLSIAAWLVFGLLLLGRWRRGWRGRRAVRWTLAGMALLLLAFVGSKFVLEIVLGRVA